MYKYDPDSNKLEEISKTSFKDLGIKETEHIEEWIRKNPEILGEDLLIITHQYDKFENDDRLDLLAIDNEGALVIIELKRDKSGSKVDFQSLKYCSYCSQLSPQDIIEIYKEYLNKYNISDDENSAVTLIAKHLDLDNNNEDKLNEILNNKQKFILAGKEIDQKILSVCAWLSDNGINCKCISIRPFKEERNNNILIDVNQIIPPYKIEDYYIGTKKTQNKATIKQPEYIVDFFKNIVVYVNNNSNLRINYNSRKPYCYINSGSNIRFTLRYLKRNNQFSIHAHINDSKLKNKMESLYNEHKSDLEKLIDNKIMYRPEGEKNPDVSRIETIFDIDTNKALNEYIEDIGNKYIKISEYLIEQWNKT